MKRQTDIHGNIFFFFVFIESNQTSASKNTFFYTMHVRHDNKSLKSMKAI